MKYKLICSDFDGTLLGTDDRIAQKNIAAVKKYMAKGGKFVVVTGRMSVCMPSWCEILGNYDLPLFAAGFNGGLALDKNGEVIFEESVAWQTAEKIISYAEKEGFHVHTYEKDNVLMPVSDDISKQYCIKCNITEREVGHLSDFVRENKHDCYKVMIVVDSERQKEVYDYLISQNYEGVNVVTSSEYFVEVVPSSGGKGNALKKIAEFYGVDMSEVIAIGDQRNDIPMIEAAGLGCCVANALDEVKSASDYVCSCTNDEGAIAEIIEKFTEEE